MPTKKRPRPDGGSTPETSSRAARAGSGSGKGGGSGTAAAGDGDVGARPTAARRSASAFFAPRRAAHGVRHATSAAASAAADGTATEDETKDNTPASKKKARSSTGAPVLHGTYRGCKLPKRWGAHESVLVWNSDPAPTPSSKIAAFDYDGCLAKTSLFRREPEAWKPMFDDDLELAKLKFYHDQGYKLVIVTNEFPIGRCKNAGPIKRAIKKKTHRVSKFVEWTGLPFLALIATAKDDYRKPGTGCWRLIEQLNEGVDVDKESSFFVGDAAGRPRPKEKDSDLMFAKAVGVKFYSETQFFLGEKT